MSSGASLSAVEREHLELQIDKSWSKVEQLESALSRQLWEQGAARRALAKVFDEARAEYERLKAIERSAA
jgi:hypothetical protein